MDQLSFPSCWYQHRSSEVDPLLVGFECHKVMREKMGLYDVYCYLEDDLVVHDPDMFEKVLWFAKTFGTESALGAHRYEIEGGKLYVDGDIPIAWTIETQDVTDVSTLHATIFNRQITFARPTNPHSGCFFLSSAQLNHWANQPYFLDGDTRFVGPLESAATLGVMRAFRLYKPAPEDASFFEIEHMDTKWTRWANVTCAAG